MLRWILVGGLCAVSGAACSDPAPDDDNQLSRDGGPRQVIPLDAGQRVDLGPGVLPGEDGGEPDPDEGVEPDPPDMDGEDPHPDGGTLEPDGMVVGPPRLVANIVLTEQPQVPSATAEVSVAEPAAIQPGPGCVVVPVNPDAPPVAPPPDYDAGEVTISGLARGDLVFRYGASDYAAGGAVPNDLFAGGAPLSVQAAGGPHMPGFELQINAPQDVQVSAPRQLNQYDQDNDLAVGWNAAGGDLVVITVFPVKPFGVEPDRGDWIICVTDDSGGFSIPSAHVRRLDPDILGRGALVAVTRTHLATAQVGPHEAIFSASTSTGVPITITR